MTATERPAFLSDAVNRRRPGWSLEQVFYTNAELFEFERRTVLRRQWFVAAHRSEIPAAGSYIVRDVLGESIIFVRGTDNQVRGFYNVCRHRGSRICMTDGSAKRLICPYHSWTYALDGRLVGAAALPENVDRSELGLTPIQVTELGGILLCALAADAPPLEASAMLRDFLDYQGMPTARIAVRRQYPTAANWKLVLENFSECYHCRASHPEYSEVMGHIQIYGVDTPAAAEKWSKEVNDWTRGEALDDLPACPIWGTANKWEHAEVARWPIGAGRKTQSKDGEGVAPLMGKYPRYDGGVAALSFGSEFIAFFGLNDHAVLFQFAPLAAEMTGVTITWLVNGSAPPESVDIERMVWLWDVTTVQDKSIVEANADGVRSSAYLPGPYSTLERWTDEFVTRYVADLRDS